MLLIFFCGTENCSVQTDNFEVIQTGLESLNYHYTNSPVLKKKLYLITELDGCGACLDFTIKFIEKNSENPNMSFIISGESKKKLNIFFTKKILTSPNLIFDSIRIGVHKKLIGIGHPKIYLCRENKIVDIKEVTFSNADSVFNYVDNFIKK